MLNQQYNTIIIIFGSISRIKRQINNFFLTKRQTNKQIDRVFFHTPKLELHIALNM